MRLRTRAVVAAGVALGGFVGTVQLWATGPVPTPTLQLVEAPARQARPLAPPRQRPAAPAPRRASLPPEPSVPREEQIPESAPAPAEDPDLARVPVDLGLPRAEPNAEPNDPRTGAGLEASQPLTVQPVTGASDLDTAVHEADEAPFF
jgi:hypothetical protein